MFPFTAVIFGGGVILLDYINKIAPYPLIGLVSYFTWGLFENTKVYNEKKVCDTIPDSLSVCTGKSAISDLIYSHVKPLIIGAIHRIMHHVVYGPLENVKHI